MHESSDLPPAMAKYMARPVLTLAGTASENYPLAWLAVRLRGSSLAKASLFEQLRGADLRKTDLRQAVLREATADLTTW